MWSSLRPLPTATLMHPSAGFAAHAQAKPGCIVCDCRNTSSCGFCKKHCAEHNGGILCAKHKESEKNAERQRQKRAAAEQQQPAQGQL